jgi:guanosine-3',5'-bis(diphosphate) 3'-pyrophosphohydrolase
MTMSPNDTPTGYDETSQQESIILAMTDSTVAHSFAEARRLIHALAFAAHKHRDQRRKDKDASPYINHPIALAHILISEGGVSDAVVLCAAILHDTIEDTETTYDELKGIFGPEIADVVQEVTDDKSLEKAERKLLQIEHAAHASPRAQLVKLADKTANLRDLASTPPHDWSAERRREYFDWAKKVIDGVRGINPQLEAAFDKAYAARG